MIEKSKGENLSRLQGLPRVCLLLISSVSMAMGTMLGQLPAAAYADPAVVTYEVSSSSGKPFMVLYVTVADVDSLNRTHQHSLNEKVGSPWRRDVSLNLGADYAMIMVMSDPSNIDPRATFSCRISSNFQQIDANSQQGMVGCAGKKLREGPRG